MATSMEAQAILNLQRYLRALSREDPAIPPVDEDGIYGPATRAAVTAFQQREGLPPTGVVDPVTWERLYGAYLTALEANTRPREVPLFPRAPADYSVGVGDEGVLVAVIQLLLREVLILWGVAEADRLAVDGVFGPDTQAAVGAIQTAYRLPVSGRVDRLTWNSLVRGREGSAPTFR